VEAQVDQKVASLEVAPRRIIQPIAEEGSRKDVKIGDDAIQQRRRFGDEPVGSSEASDGTIVRRRRPAIELDNRNQAPADDLLSRRRRFAGEAVPEKPAGEGPGLPNNP
jgi:hypothetical protein